MASRQSKIEQGTVWIYCSSEEVARSVAADLAKYPTGGQPFSTDIQCRPGQSNDREWRVRGHAVLPANNVANLEADMRSRFPHDGEAGFRGYEPTPAGKPFPPSEPYTDN